MAHDGEEFISRRDRIVGRVAFMRKVFVRFLASARQQREMFRAFLAKDFIRGVPLLLKNSILTSSLAGQKLRDGRPRGRAIAPGARGRQQIVRTASSAADDSIGRLIDSDVLTGPIRLFALDPQAFVGLFALKAPLLVFWRHRSREVYTSALMVLTPNNPAQDWQSGARLRLPHTDGSAPVRGRERVVQLQMGWQRRVPGSFAADADRLARFRREAQTLAALNRPNIAAVYGFEKFAASDDQARLAGSGRFGALIMELVPGEDLSVHIARGRITSAEAVPIARQIADALETATRSGHHPPRSEIQGGAVEGREAVKTDGRASAL